MAKTRETAVAVVASISGVLVPSCWPGSTWGLVLREKWSRGQVETRLANTPACLIGMEACVGAHHLSRRLTALSHDVRLMPVKYVRPYPKGQKNDFRDTEAIAGQCNAQR